MQKRKTRDRERVKKKKKAKKGEFLLVLKFVDLRGSRGVMK